MSTDLMPEERLLAALVRRAIKDAQGKQERTREEADGDCGRLRRALRNVQGWRLRIGL